ncbi:MAG: hypothetical protein ABIZ64_12130 [Casimicrobium sp.]
MSVISDKRCSISLIVNGQRWQQDALALASLAPIERPWSLGGLQDYARLIVGSQLGFTLEQTDLVDQRWCRAKANPSDGEAVSAGFTVVTAPHINAEDMGAGLALDAVESVAIFDPDVIVTVGSQIQWQPMRLKLEARSMQLFELLLPAAGKVVVSGDRVIDLRDRARQEYQVSPVSSLFKPMPVIAGDEPKPTPPSTSIHDDSFAANAISGTVKSLANGYGMITRKDGRGDVQFLAGHVVAPGFDFVEIGDVMRFDVVRVASGKWLAQRVVRA